MAVEMTTIPIGSSTPASVVVLEDEEVHPNILWILIDTDLLEVLRHGQKVLYRRVAL